MEGAWIILGFTVAVGFVLWLLDKRGRRREDSSETAPPPADTASSGNDEGECCGLHMTCEKDTLVPFSTEIEYYDDEELDRFAGRGADGYSDVETEEFRDVLLTMRPEEIAGWSRSLQLRGITPPAEIREEMLLIVGEERKKATK